MPRRTTVRAKLVRDGVDIIDHTGSVLTGITNQDAVDLYLSLAPRMRRIIREARLDAGLPVPKIKRRARR